VVFVRHLVRGNKTVRLILKTINEGVATEGYVSFPPGLLSCFRFWYGPTLKKECIMKCESFNRMAAEKSTVVSCGDSYVVRPQRRR